MYLNEFADDLAPRDMSGSEEFASLLASARELGIPHAPAIRYASRQTIVRHQRFHVLEWGDVEHPPVLLLHGGNQSAHSWDLVSLHLADRYHIVAPDQRGHGDSEWSRDVDYTLGALARDAAALIGDRGLRSPIIVGHSMGGMVALLLAKLHPEILRALVIVDVAPELSERGTAVIRDFVKRNVEFDDPEEFLDRVARYDPFRKREHMARTLKYNLLRRADGKYVSKHDRRRVDDPFGSEIVTLDCVRQFAFPTLVVRGGESTVLEPDAAERFTDALPEGRLVTVPDCGHNVHSQNTPGFLAALVPFLESAARDGS
jgi:pimeloyl-ACP methyl ester carboxylesterase